MNMERFIMFSFAFHLQSIQISHNTSIDCDHVKAFLQFQIILSNGDMQPRDYGSLLSVTSAGPGAFEPRSPWVKDPNSSSRHLLYLCTSSLPTS